MFSPVVPPISSATATARGFDTVVTAASDCIFSQKQTRCFWSELRALAPESKVAFTSNVVVASPRSHVERELRVTKTENSELHEQLREVSNISVYRNFYQ